MIRTQQTGAPANNLYDRVSRQSYFKLTDGYARSIFGESDTGITFSTKRQELYGEETAVKGQETYGVDLDQQTAKDYYQEELDEYLLPLKYLPFDEKAIRKGSYQQEIALAEIWENLQFPKNTQDNEIIDGFKEGDLVALRISYDRSFRPTKVEGYYTDASERGWHDLLYLDYPDLSEESFSKNLDAYIQTIQNDSDEEEATLEVEDQE